MLVQGFVKCGTPHPKYGDKDQNKFRSASPVSFSDPRSV